MDNYERLVKIVNFAAEKHINQRRKGDNSPYINHHLGVAQIIMDAGVKTPLIIEDTDTTPEEIKELFGEDVLKVILEVSDDKSLPKVQRKRF